MQDDAVGEMCESSQGGWRAGFCEASDYRKRALRTGTRLGVSSTSCFVSFPSSQLVHLDVLYLLFIDSQSEFSSYIRRGCCYNRF